jgi:concentrative nucleoside transporter, CNT family
LDVSHQHHHAHLHHDANAERGRDDEVAYAAGTSFQKSDIPDQSPQDIDYHRRRHSEKAAETGVGDAEKGTVTPVSTNDEDPPKRGFSAFYARYRIFFHLAIWLVFTG